MGYHKLISFAVFLGIILHFVDSHDAPEPRKQKISPSLNDAFETDESIKKDIVVTFKQKTSQVLNMFDLSSRANGDAITEEQEIELHTNYIDQLKMLKTESQSEILSFLEGEAPENHQSFWISNEIYVKGANKELCEALGSFENVDVVEEQKIFHIHKPLEEGPVIDKSRLMKNDKKVGINGEDLEWNIVKIRADKAWEGKVQKPCRVGIIDTGIRATHEAFDTINIAGWHDAVNGEDTPYDDNGHGTHVAGVIAGITGIGVASDCTEIICCKACTGSGSCSQKALTECCQFMTEKRPNIVSNSWGGPPGEATYTDIISSWKALNMFAVFSAGNSGPSCDSVGSPGDHVNVISVGATTRDDSLADFSSRGECKSGMMGPAVTAPGQNINSAWMSSDTSYKSISGTSMAAPHVSGLYALMCSRHPGISFDHAKAAIIKSCKHSGLEDPNQTCGGTSFKQVPNNLYGNGVIDCVNTMKFLDKAKKSKVQNPP